MKKVFNSLLVISIFIGCFALIKWLKKGNSSDSKFKVGVMQTASHPALDAVLNGLKKNINDSIYLDVKNAQGEVAQAHTIAHQLHTDKSFDLFFTIATPTTQAIAAIEKERPVVLSAVTDPAALGLTGKNVCGISDMIDVAGQVKMIKQLIPDAKKIGLVYTSGEVNATSLASKMRQELKTQGFSVQDFASADEADMLAIMDTACRKSDVILAPTDNVVALAIGSLSNIALKNKTPFIVSDNMLVENGPLAARGVDYEECGTTAAKIVNDILINKKEPAEIGIQQAPSKNIFINKSTLDTLGLNISKTLTDKIIIV